MSKTQSKRKPKVQSESDDDDQPNTGKDNAGEEMLLVGGGDELGAFDDSQFQENDGEKKKKVHNVVRK